MKIPIDRIATIGNYLPRKCGIATFTTDVSEAIADEFKQGSVITLAINDTEEGYDYPRRVCFEIDEQDLGAYKNAASFLNSRNIDVINLQHEFGIFGGPDGSHILSLLREVNSPVVTTLHTVLENPTPGQLDVMLEMARLSDRFVVMSRRAERLLKEIYDVPAEKIDFIHHGIPDVPFLDPSYNKDLLGVEGKTVLLTFGLLSPNKGIEYAIEALPHILENHPDVVYVVLGATHPHLLRSEGEAYREQLHELARSLSVEQNVLFENRFVSLEDLCMYIGAADIYITPYLNRDQITSGTLAYAAGAGKAIISTPYWYAEELLSEGKGMLVPFKDSKSIAETAVSLIGNEVVRHAMRKRAYKAGREMIWTRVAERYKQSFEEAVANRRRGKTTEVSPHILPIFSDSLPPFKLDHLRTMTDDTGLLQHAKFNVPNYAEGYSIDDNARALILTSLLSEFDEDAARDVASLQTRYLAFLYHAWNPECGRFRNFLSYDRRWLEDSGSEDSNGRTLWALGTLTRRGKNDSKRELATQLFDTALPAVLEFTSPRAWAFTLLGINEYLYRYPEHRTISTIGKALTGRLMDSFTANSSDDWLWFEEELAYSNAKLAHALMIGGERFGDDRMRRTGLAALAWLVDIQRMNCDYFVPIGCKGFYLKSGHRARFDQQPIEAHVTISACLHAYRLTGDEQWKREARIAFEWFLGQNDVGIPLYDPATGGCCDGLHPSRVNQNQGAESTLAYMLSHTEMRAAMALTPKHSNLAKEDVIARSNTIEEVPKQSFDALVDGGPNLPRLIEKDRLS